VTNPSGSWAVRDRTSVDRGSVGRARKCHTGARAHGPFARRGRDAIDTRRTSKSRRTSSTPRVPDAHHLRLFFGELVDPAWLTPMYEAGMVRFPRPDQMWPVTAMIDGLGRTCPNAVAELLLRLLGDAHPGDELRDIRYFEALRMAAHLGNAGHPVVAEVVRRYSGCRRPARSHPAISAWWSRRASSSSTTSRLERTRSVVSVRQPTCARCRSQRADHPALPIA
jgi:hypothetical protein